MQTWESDLNALHLYRKLGVVAWTCNHMLERQSQGEASGSLLSKPRLKGAPQIPETDLVSKNKDGGPRGTTPKADFWPPHIHINCPIRYMHHRKSYGKKLANKKIWLNLILEVRKKDPKHGLWNWRSRYTKQLDSNKHILSVFSHAESRFFLKKKMN